MSLRPVHGHVGARRSLAGARARGSLPASMLIHGHPGVGKQRLALWVGQLLLCEAPHAEQGPCGSCRSCRLALRLEHPDLHWYFPLARPRGSHTPQKLAEMLEEARYAELTERREEPLRATWSDEPRGFYLVMIQTLRRSAHTRPSMGGTQVFVLGDAEHLVPQEASPEAANALLKLLEEPPGGTRFILTSSQPGRMLPTIRSRTLHLHLPVLGRDEVETFLVEVAGADPGDAARAADLAQGSIGRGLGFLPDGDGPGPLERLRRDAYDLLSAGLDPGAGAGFRTALRYRPSGARGLLDLFGFLEGWIRDVAAVAAGAPERVINADALERIERAVRRRDVGGVGAAGALAVMEEAREQAMGNVNPQLIVAGLVAGLRRHFGNGGSG